LQCEHVSLNLGTLQLIRARARFSVALIVGRKLSGLQVRHISNASRYS
jgi:hypothetical protein